MSNYTLYVAKSVAGLKRPCARLSSATSSSQNHQRYSFTTSLSTSNVIRWHDEPYTARSGYGSYRYSPALHSDQQRRYYSGSTSNNVNTSFHDRRQWGGDNNTHGFASLADLRDEDYDDEYLLRNNANGSMSSSDYYIQEENFDGRERYDDLKGEDEMLDNMYTNLQELMQRSQQDLYNKNNLVGLDYDDNEAVHARAHDQLVGMYNDTKQYDATRDDHRPQRYRSVDLLRNFDPQNPPSSNDPIALQLWIECQAQQEQVLKYQNVIKAARERHDFGSMSMVQRLIVKWFEPLVQEISEVQKSYMMKNMDNDDEEDSDDKIKSKMKGKKIKAKKKGMAKTEDSEDADESIDLAKSHNITGPFLCSLSPEKLAVVAAHGAIVHMLMRSSGDHGRNGVSFVSLAKRLGEVVEEEVVMQRILKNRFKYEAEAFNKQQDAANNNNSGGESSIEARLLNEFLNSSNDDHISVSSSSDSSNGADDGDSDDVMRMFRKGEVKDNWTYAASHLRKYLKEMSENHLSLKKRRVINYALRRARQVVDRDEPWSESSQIQLGAYLFQILLKHATVRNRDMEELVFKFEKKPIGKGRCRGFVTLNESLYKLVTSDDLQSLSPLSSRQKPMIVPAKPWTSVDSGGYLWLRSDLLRVHGSNIQKEVLRQADLSTVFDGLNSLSKVSWKINKRVLEVAKQCWERDVPLGDIPSRTDFDVPSLPEYPEQLSMKLDKTDPALIAYYDAKKDFQEGLQRHKRRVQKNMDLVSLRCSVMLKLDQAEKFKNFDKIYFPYNMDFRGRAYPIPPHLSNVGSDLCRGLLMFSEGKPLGKRGFYWLKVHLANFAGADKMTFDDRAKYVEDRMDLVRQSVDDPFGPNAWWMTLDDPFQGLATCYEIINAIDSGDPESYVCALSVHMDGSCNGLQHYAALGRDPVGGKAVNLCAYDEPQDVYIGVMHEVIRRVAEEAERQLSFDANKVEKLSKSQKKELQSHRAAQLVNGLIDRGVVKRTVMTSVYGVTYIGARTQIQEKIEEKLENAGRDVDELQQEIFNASGYLANVTMDVIGDLFTGAKGTMNWLTTCARMISQHGYPVAWVTPIGLPAIQPYRQKKSATIVTLTQIVTVAQETDDLPLHKTRQVSAFPPNYVHSLDSSHMLLTALEMEKRGLAFSAVHDSFWTHACDVDEMNVALRDVFVDLYNQPLLENLKKTWEMRYPDLNFPDVPKRGALDLDEVKRAKYFFQ